MHHWLFCEWIAFTMAKFPANVGKSSPNLFAVDEHFKKMFVAQRSSYTQLLALAVDNSNSWCLHIAYLDEIAFPTMAPIICSCNWTCCFDFQDFQVQVNAKSHLCRCQKCRSVYAKQVCHEVSTARPL